MGMADPKPQFSYLVEQLRKHKLAYIHIIEPETSEHNSDFLRNIWDGREGSTFISANGHDRKSAIETADKKGGLVAFGRLFISNVSSPWLDSAEADYLSYSPTFHSAC
jgi:NADPH2 dehydrogenase